MRARADITVAGRISTCEALWYDTARWPSFVDGFHHVVRRAEGWPTEGEIIWDSSPGGRARVIETVERYEPRAGQTVRVEDEKITGTQSIAFLARPDDRVQVTLELRYSLKERPLGPVSRLVDALFILPRQRDALRRTLARFARELAVDRELTGG